MEAYALTRIKGDIPMKLDSFGISDTGRQRMSNQDSYLCNPAEKLYLLADGMGGQVAGDIASSLSIKTLEEFVIRSRSEDITWPIPFRKELSLEENILLAGATQANHKIRELSNQNPTLKGMGTTLIGAIIAGDRLATINIGDSRLYRIRDGDIEQMTQDHTLAGEQERLGLLKKEEAARHPQSHILASALGIERVENIRIDLCLVDIREQDLFLLCSDGLNDMLDDGEILSTINSAGKESLEKIGRSLTQRANRAGGRDNITIILLYFY